MILFVGSTALPSAFASLVLAVLGVGISLAAAGVGRPRRHATVTSIGAGFYYAGWIWAALQGALYSRLGLVLAAAIAVLIGLWVVVNIARIPGGNTGVQAATLVVAVVSTAAVVLQLVLPGGTSLAPANTCTDTATSGSALLVRTNLVGENARTGPSTTYPAANRFDGGCVLGIDGYCIGEAVTDRTVDLPDDRWLRLRYSTTFVAAATVTEIQTDAGLLPDSSCTSYHPPAARLQGRTLIHRSKDRRYIALETTSTGLPLVGYALYEPQQSAYSRVVPLNIAPRTVKVGYSNAYVPADLTTDGGKRLDSVIVAVVPCLAANTPAPDIAAQYYGVSLSRGRGTTSTADVYDDGDRLRQAACRIDPNSDGPALSAASTAAAAAAVAKANGDATIRWPQ